MTPLQADLFRTQPELPPDEVETCTGCGATILTQHFTPGHIESEFIGDEGQCFRCAFPKKGRKSA